VEGVNSNMIYSIHCKNLCKCHNVPPVSTTIKEKNKDAIDMRSLYILRLNALGNNNLNFCTNKKGSTHFVYQKMHEYFCKIYVTHTWQSNCLKNTMMLFTKLFLWNLESLAKFLILVLIKLSVIKREDFKAYVVSCFIFLFSYRNSWLKQVWDISYQY
jgi:hypothetical protein